jgi:succinate dehydrogenase/fumarate reductase flavoprotein subunit
LGSFPSFATHVRSTLLADYLSPRAAAAPAAAAAAAGGSGPMAMRPGVQPGEIPDAVVVGTGVAGMTAALRLLDRGAKVVVLDKERQLGGNSAKASSGINACCPPHSRSKENTNDTVDAFAADTAKSASHLARSGLISVLVQHSSAAIGWLLKRTSIDLSMVSQLGGHAHARTHRPANGMVGAELTFALQKELKAYVKTGQLSLRTGCRMTGFLLEGADGQLSASAEGDGSAPAAGAVPAARVVGVRYVEVATGAVVELRAAQTVLATGGFANDRTNTSLLARHRPDLLVYPTTNGEWATGDGMKMAMAIGAGSVDMDRVQIHPTGFVDPAHPTASTKVLCGEMMRGVGGILLTPAGERFVNELAPRDKVVDGQIATGASEFVLVLNQPMATEAGRHVELYVKKGLLVKVASVDGLAQWMLSPDGVAGAAQANANCTDGAGGAGVAALAARLRATLEAYAAAAEAGHDTFGKKDFRHGDFEPEATLYAGRIVPVLHYTMGGIRMDEGGRVLREDGSVIEGLSAAGEVTGGVHGNNRLGGNSLLECTVFGSIVGERLPIASLEAPPTLAAGLPAAAAAAAPLPAAGGVAAEGADASAAAAALRTVSAEELAAHNSWQSCWVALHGKVYDFTAFLDEHPAGPESILKLGGTDGTEMYETVHNVRMLDDFQAELVGVYAP